ncbi:sigma-54-dependent transcriptional regulator [Luteibacter sp. UNCMF366Tsu5.1]|uniref:sigma-54-dependent transcriptional regulator n=1 Tax=Luteibacter sp. UNCMF366Tsu5.1 TaxID=1502758 RepID=UPI000908ECBF|nr:sigma-54 dependent transcriptional regulator [Luteibacter sp. UNCMF366Tsu5.1]SFW64430.1 DNA-binding transcriptional response regulator, NtrC family, contains REC, AAA-type ATPase, and a Fis-type DNA-binding domains [Luteibacter sp. UNCMF366Tsu5.1]
MTILIVDDDSSIVGALRLLLTSEGLASHACASPREAIEAVGRESFDVALVDLNYLDDTTSGKEGLALVRELKAIAPHLPVIAMTGWGTIGVAVEAMREGAVDFLEKPWDNHRLLNVIRTQMRLQATDRRARRLEAENEALREEGGQAGIVWRSPAMGQLLDIATRVARSDMPVLVTGENGTGKSLLAHFIHERSSRAEGPFVAVNMGALAETTFESEMFGHTKGAYTDAKADRVGRVELAEGGTLFLDEIANLAMPQQAKILRLLEERVYERLGSSNARHADVRFISATNADLDALIAERSFRQDLLYRLNGVTLHMPALRERREDIPLLADAFLKRARTRYASPATRFSAAAERALLAYAWPGNIREMQHVIERSVLLAQGEAIGDGDLQLGGTLSSGAHDDIDGLTLEEVEDWFIRRTLAQHSGNANLAAKALGISRSALYRRLGRQEPT